MPVTQFNMKDVEQAGLVKLDFLGLKTLTVLTQAEKLVRRRGIDIDLTRIPLDDPKTFAMLSHGDSTGVFQLESSGMRDVLRKLKPDRFEDVIALVALYRPGPMDDIPKYINVKNGTEPVDYLHPALEPILKETFGIMVYQEQVMQIAQTLSGYTLGGADLLRRAMGKKIKEEMEAQRRNFIDGAVVPWRGWAAGGRHLREGQQIRRLRLQQMPLRALCADRLSDGLVQGQLPRRVLRGLDDLRHQQHRQAGPLPPGAGAPQDPPAGAGHQQVARRSSASRPMPRASSPCAMPWPPCAMSGRGPPRGSLRHGSASRAAPFKSLADFARRCDPKALNKRALENLIAAGAFDGINPNRHQTFQAAEMLLRQAGAAANDRASQQVSLFGGALAEPDRLSLPATPDWPPMEKLRHEFEAIGFYLSAHPLDSFGSTLKRLDVVSYVDLPGWIAGRPTMRAKLAGIVTGRQERTSAKGSRFAFAQLSDASGMYEVVVFSETLAAHRELLEPGTPVLLTVDVRLEPDNVRLTAQAIQGLEAAAAQTSAGLKVYLSDSGPIPSLKQIMERCGRGKGRLRLVLELERGRECEVVGARGLGHLAGDPGGDQGHSRHRRCPGRLGALAPQRPGSRRPKPLKKRLPLPS